MHFAKDVFYRLILIHFRAKFLLRSNIINIFESKLSGLCGWSAILDLYVGPTPSSTNTSSIAINLIIRFHARTLSLNMHSLFNSTMFELVIISWANSPAPLYDEFCRTLRDHSYCGRQCPLEVHLSIFRVTRNSPQVFQDKHIFISILAYAVFDGVIS